jgi:medium-chain acyl-[acyl-carrier-protein] hydrolase
MYCFPYAGGNAATFLPWQAAMGPEIEVCAVQLPGRGARLVEPPYTSMTELVAALGQVILSNNELPFVFFGHSLGGLVAFELARYCKHHYLPIPKHLFISACSAPRCRDSSPRLHELEDAALVEALKDYNGTPPEIINNHALMELVLPAIRADFKLAEDYEYRPGQTLNVPITVLTGTMDKHISVEQVVSWQEETISNCCIRVFEGDHFFINSNTTAVMDFLFAELAQLNAA